VVQLTDAAGTVTQTYDYDAFGNQKIENPADSNPFRYCGEYYDAETGTIYLRARYYDPSVGRFTRQDPARDGLNWYTYCNNNPIRFYDPTGHYYIVQNGESFNLQQDYEQVLLLGVVAQFLPFIGNTAWQELPNTVGGTSHNISSALEENFLFWNKMSTAADINEALKISHIEVYLMKNSKPFSRV